jgi:hypothetical protein
MLRSPEGGLGITVAFIFRKLAGARRWRRGAQRRCHQQVAARALTASAFQVCSRRSLRALIIPSSLLICQNE